jgi:lysophospholipase L1-like esterase
LIKYLFVFFLSFFVLYAKSQAFIDNSEKYSFVNYANNKIDYPGDSMDFVNFMYKFNKLVSTGQGKINIVHFGGSHVQADMWTGQIRSHFNKFLFQREVERGFVFPYKAIKTNGSAQYDVHYNKTWEYVKNVKLSFPEEVGLMGYKAIARDSGQYVSFDFKSEFFTKYVFDEILVYHDTGSSYFDFTIQVDSNLLSAEYSSDCKCSKFIFPSNYSSFKLVVHKTNELQSMFVLNGIQTKIQNNSGLVYHNVGVNGASVPSFLNCLDLDKQLKVLNPDLIVFAVGINDAFGKDFSRPWFENNYSLWIKRIREVCPGVAILLLTNTDSYKTIKRRKYKNYSGNEVRNSMYLLGKTHGAAVWDLYSVMGGLGSIQLWNRNGMAQSDLIHLTGNGYRYLGDLFFEAFLKKYDSFVQNNLSYLSYE